MTTSPLDTVDSGRRDALRKLIIGSALAVPVVASFGMGATPASAQQICTNGNTSNCIPPNAVAVPTMGEMAMIGVGGALAVAGVMTAYGVKSAG